MSGSSGKGYLRVRAGEFIQRRENDGLEYLEIARPASIDENETVSAPSSVRLEPRDPRFEARVRASFERQAVMHTIGARLVRVEPGSVEIELPFRADLTQQHGFLHAGIVTTVLDSACGYAALSVMPAGAAVLSVEFKINLLAPAAGERVRAVARVVKPGRTLVVCAGDVYAVADGRETLAATMQGTMMAVYDRPGLSD